MATHTTGPWTWIEYPSGAKLLAAPSGAVIHSPFPMAFEPMTVKPEDRALIAAAPDGLAFAKAVEKWEADLLECSEAWANGLPVFTQELYDSWMELQAMRNAFVAKAEATP